MTVETGLTGQMSVKTISSCSMGTGCEDSRLEVAAEIPITWISLTMLSAARSGKPNPTWLEQ